jgi:hypothetical protein
MHLSGVLVASSHAKQFATRRLKAPFTYTAYSLKSKPAVTEISRC